MDRNLQELLLRLGGTRGVSEYIKFPMDSIRRWRREGVPKIRREMVAEKLIDLMLEEV